MIQINDIRTIYFVGVGGIGMSALARYFLFKGCRLSGYDKTPTPLTKALEQEGVAIHYTEDITLIPTDVDVVVYTPAIPKQHAELVYYQQNNYTVVKRSDVLQWITESSFNVCVGGTHGKTTVTSMTAHVLRHTGYGCNAFLGGIATNYGTNFWSSENNVAVIEADEYDRSFLKLVPDVAIITAVDPDHLDIYGTPAEVENAFVQFSKRLKPNGCLITKYGLKTKEAFEANHHYTYHLEDCNAAIYGANITVEHGSYVFDVIGKDWQLKQVVLNMGGLHNIENAIAAIIVAKHIGIEDEKIKAAIAAFKGVKRRFEYVLKNEAHVLIDDYAHHPEELKALITGVRSIYGTQKLTMVFQPHLFSRTNDLADAFADSLDLADEVILLPIYPARELPMEGVSSAMLQERMQQAKVTVMSKEEMVAYVQQEQPALLVMAGAGDIDALVQPVKQVLA